MATLAKSNLSRLSISLSIPAGLPDLGVASCTPREPVGNPTAKLPEALQRAVAQAEKTAIVVADIDGVIQWSNEAFTRQSGQAADEIRGRQLEAFLTGLDGKPGSAANLVASLANGERFSMAREFAGNDGRTLWVDTVVERICDASGAPAGYILVQDDASLRRIHEQELASASAAIQGLDSQFEQAIERAQQLAVDAAVANQAKSAFLAMMSHEIRTPLNGVLGMASILEATELNDDQRDCLRTIKMSGEALLAVINDTLDFSKIEAGRLELEDVEFDVRACAEEAADLLAARAFAKNLELVCDFAENMPRYVRGDPVRLRQVFVNLLGNAVKFTTTGEVVLEGRLETCVGGVGTLRFGVRDTGIGIPKDKQHRLFKSFSQVDASTTREYGGTGLGLVISKKIVELMGGTLSVESAEGRGSTFAFTMVTNVVKFGAADALLAGKSAYSRVLVVDDNETSRTVLLRHLARLKIEAVGEAHGAAASARLEAGEKFDLVLIDYRMPGDDGVVWAQRIMAGGRKTCPFLLMNAVGETGADKAIDGIVRKPIRREALALRLAQSLPEEGTAPLSEAQGADLLADTARRRPLKILLAEDNAVNQLVARHQLAKFGYTATMVENGALAVVAMLTGDFDLVLMDVQMPECDGYEATRRIRAKPAFKTRPWIVAMTAGAGSSDREDAIASGMDDYLSKPLRPELLEVMLARAHAAGQPAPPTGSPDPGGALSALSQTTASVDGIRVGKN